MPGLDKQFWNKSMADTLAACYKGFHSDSYSRDMKEQAPAEDFAAALHWIHDEWRRRNKEQKRTEVSEEETTIRK